MMNICYKLQLLGHLSNPLAVAHSCATGDSYFLPLLLGAGRIQGLERGSHLLRRVKCVVEQRCWGMLILTQLN